jgi:hypothetical protein
MDIERLASIVRALSTTPSRRRVSRVLAGLTAGSILAPLVDPITGEAKKRKKKKKCKGGKKKCGKICVDIQNDANNCGGCGKQCANGQACEDGECQEPPPPQCAAGEIACEYLCCSATQECCGNGLNPLCYDPATESCCPDWQGFGTVCPPGTRCETFDDPYDTVGAYPFCCPSGTTTCVHGCCPEGYVCCPYDTGFGIGADCCPDGACDVGSLDCISNGDNVVDPRIF